MTPEELVEELLAHGAKGPRGGWRESLSLDGCEVFVFEETPEGVSGWGYVMVYRLTDRLHSLPHSALMYNEKSVRLLEELKVNRVLEVCP